MKILGHQHHDENIFLAGNFIYPGYVVRGKEKSLMIDCGLNILGPRYLADIGKILGDPSALSMLFLTHSHYDHLGAAPYLKRKISSLELGGHEKIEALLKKETVLQRMGDLSEIQRMLFRDLEEDDTRLEPIVLAHSLKEGDTFDLGGLTCRVFSTPGHTADSMAYFFPETGVLFPGESIGVPQGKDGSGVQAEFLSSYDEYVASIKKMMDLEPRVIYMAHAWIFTGEDVRDFFRDSLEETERYRELIEGYLVSAGGDTELAVREMVRVEYDEKGTIFQERNAYMMNLAAQVNHIAGLMRPVRG